ncbi:MULTISPECIES: hypothetical protein [unclassified Streptomyces]|uniref:hypothetical protein n=1 Tax=unclassified Streptomyces TaxID=2593676 RepID=UPI00093BACA8|nr:hypothetical protein [Streptomyces sp. CB02009]OKJ52211.1 hypothetical protein AMK27_30690 [Streptomyces sp. CB02009]
MAHRTQLPPETEPSRLVQAADGSRWLTAGRNAAGEQLYVPEAVDVDTCPMWVRAEETGLVEATGGPLTAVDEEAAA